MFAILCDGTVGEYIRNRRLTLAGYELLSSDSSSMDITIKYGYETNESFTRAFSRFHGVTPSTARKNRVGLHTFSRISVKSNLSGGKVMMTDFSKRDNVGLKFKEIHKSYNNKEYLRLYEAGTLTA